MHFPSIAIEVTPRCNQRCRYCYNGWRGENTSPSSELSAGEIVELLDRALQDARFDQVTLTGGEPFLREDLVQIIEQINARNLPVAIISNGSALTETVASMLAKSQMAYVQVTLLSPRPETHDSLCGPGSFVRATQAIQRLVRHGIPVGSSFLCTRQNYTDAGATLELFAQLGAKHHYCFNRFNPSGHARNQALQLLPTRSQILQALHQTSQFAERHNLRINCTMPIPLCMIEEQAFPHIEFGQCSAGTEQAEYVINYRGELKLCALQSASLGRLCQAGFAELIGSSKARQFRQGVPAFCQECPHQSSCLGGCRAAAQWVFGREVEIDPFLAQHVMPGFEHFIREQK